MWPDGPADPRAPGRAWHSLRNPQSGGTRSKPQLVLGRPYKVSMLACLAQCMRALSLASLLGPQLPAPMQRRGVILAMEGRRPHCGPTCSFQADIPPPLPCLEGPLKTAGISCNVDMLGARQVPASRAGHMSSVGFLCFCFPWASQRSPHILEMPLSHFPSGLKAGASRTFHLHDPNDRVAQPGHPVGGTSGWGGQTAGVTHDRPRPARPRVPLQRADHLLLSSGKLLHKGRLFCMWVKAFPSMTPQRQHLQFIPFPVSPLSPPTSQQQQLSTPGRVSGILKEEQMDPSAQTEILSSSSSPSSLAPSEHFPGREEDQKDEGNAFRSHPRSDTGPGL